MLVDDMPIWAHISAMTTANDIRKSLRNLSKRMKAKRQTLPAREGFRPGVRPAAAACGISPTTYARIERGGYPDLSVYLAILDWLES